MTKRPRLKKRFGQHHLRDGGLCRPLLEYLRPNGQTVLEIGPGGGILTAELVQAGARVVALEVDLEWALRLPKVPRCGGVRIAVLDAMALDWSRFTKPVQVTGNLPFNVAGPILRSLLLHATAVERSAFMVQKEVAERLCAGPGEKPYGALSVLVAARAEAKILGTIRPGSFRPPPKVEASFIGLEPRQPPLDPALLPEFETLVRQAFAMRRKTLLNALGAAWGKEEARAVLEAASIAPGLRAERLALGEFLALFAARHATEKSPSR